MMIIYAMELAGGNNEVLSPAEQKLVVVEQSVPVESFRQRFEAIQKQLERIGQRLREIERELREIAKRLEEIGKKLTELQKALSTPSFEFLPSFEVLLFFDSPAFKLPSLYNSPNELMYFFKEQLFEKEMAMLACDSGLRCLALSDGFLKIHEFLLANWKGEFGKDLYEADPTPGITEQAFFQHSKIQRRSDNITAKEDEAQWRRMFEAAQVFYKRCLDDEKKKQAPIVRSDYVRSLCLDIQQHLKGIQKWLENEQERQIWRLPCNQREAIRAKMGKEEADRNKEKLTRLKKELDVYIKNLKVRGDEFAKQVEDSLAAKLLYFQKDLCDLELENAKELKHRIETFVARASKTSE